MENTSEKKPTKTFRPGNRKGKFKLKKKTYKISSRLNEEEYKMFIDKCAELSYSKSDLIRDSILSFKNENSLKYKKEYIISLKKIGVNINQIAQTFNTNLYKNRVGDIDHYTKKINEYLNEIFKIVEDLKS